MKDSVVLGLIVFFAISVFAGTTASASSSSPAKATKSEQLTPKSTSDELAALKRSCQGLGGIKSKLQQIKGTLSEISKIHNDFKSVNAKIKQESLTPVFEKRTISKQTSQDKTSKPTDFIPAEKRRAQIGVIQQMQKISGDMKRVKQKLTLQEAHIRQGWKGIEGDLRQVSGGTSTSSPDRQCVSREARQVDDELATLQSQAESLKSQLDDLKSQLDQQFGQGSCAGRIPQNCSSTECENCCKWQFKIAASEGSHLRRIQETERNSCIIQCKQVSATCIANSLYNLLSTVLKQVNDMRGGVIRNMM